MQEKNFLIALYKLEFLIIIERKITLNFREELQKKNYFTIIWNNKLQFR